MIHLFMAGIWINPSTCRFASYYNAEKQVLRILSPRARRVALAPSRGLIVTTVPCIKSRSDYAKTPKVGVPSKHQPSATTSTMLRRAPLTTISGNKSLRKELDLLTKGKIAEEAKLEVTLI